MGGIWATVCLLQGHQSPSLESVEIHQLLGQSVTHSASNLRLSVQRNVRPTKPAASTLLASIKGHKSDYKVI